MDAVLRQSCHKAVARIHASRLREAVTYVGVRMIPVSQSYIRHSNASVSMAVPKRTYNSVTGCCGQ